MEPVAVCSLQWAPATIILNEGTISYLCRSTRSDWQILLLTHFQQMQLSIVSRDRFHNRTSCLFVCILPTLYSKLTNAEYLQNQYTTGSYKVVCIPILIQYIQFTDLSTCWISNIQIYTIKWSIGRYLSRDFCVLNGPRIQQRATLKKSDPTTASKTYCTV